MTECDNKQVDDWNEATFLGAAVGILVTVSLAAAAAVVLVLVRNRVGICCVIPDVCTVPVMAVCPNRCYMFEHGLKSITTVIEFFLLNKLKTLFSQSTCEIVHKYHLGETPFNPKYLTLRSTESH